MKRWLGLSAILITGAVFTLHDSSRAQNAPGKSGPGDGGAVLKIPGMDANPVDPFSGGKVAPPDSLKGMWNPAAFPTTQRGGKIAEPPSNHTDINKDIEIT